MYFLLHPPHPHPPIKKGWRVRSENQNPLDACVIYPKKKTEVCNMVILKAICVRKDWCLCCLQTHVHHIGQFIVLYRGVKLYCATQSVLAAGHSHLYHLYSFCYSNACLVLNFLECYNLKSYSNSFFCSFMFTSLRSI